MLWPLSSELPGLCSQCLAACFALAVQIVTLFRLGLCVFSVIPIANVQLALHYILLVATGLESLMSQVS